jgi:protein SCO1/2
MAGAAGAAGTPPQPSSRVGVAVSDPLSATLLGDKFTNQSGQTVTLGQFHGDTVFLVPFLTLCTDTCPFTTGNLLQLRRTLVDDQDAKVKVVAISVDPYRDTPARLHAYAKMIGAKFDLLTPQGTTSTPVAPPHYSGADSVGTGDVNQIDSALEQALGWQVSVIKEDKPASVDWMRPHERLTYDIDHSDGFFVINSNGVLSFVGTHAPRFKGTLAKGLAAFLDSDGRYTYAHPTKGGWTPAEALAALSWVAGRQL